MTPTTRAASPPGTWIFGFGSLIHRPGFDYTHKLCGYVKGYRRVWYQGSTDHRGTPEFPGRTVTMVPCEESITWGAAFRLAGSESDQKKTLEYLEWREKQYDIRATVDMFGETAEGKEQLLLEGALTYIASEASDNWLGPAPLDDIAQQIARAHGPSGPNTEYLYKLADAMREIDVDDPELFKLETMVKDIVSAPSEVYIN